MIKSNFNIFIVLDISRGAITSGNNTTSGHIYRRYNTSVDKIPDDTSINIESGSRGKEHQSTYAASQSSEMQINTKSRKQSHSSPGIQTENRVPVRINSVSMPDNSSCAVGREWSVGYDLNTVTSDWAIWTYENKTKCPNFDVSNIRHKRVPLISITCTENKRIRIERKTNDMNRITSFAFGSKCLELFLDTCCLDNKPVPNIVHYILYGKGEFNFYSFVSFISVIRFVRPCAVLIHGDAVPDSVYWMLILNLFPNIIQVTRTIPDNIFGTPVRHRTHISDIMRIEALLRYGGIYLDMDMVLTRPIEFLRKYPCTMSRMHSFTVASAFIMSEKNTTFLHKWLDGYRFDYYNQKYIYNAMIYPNKVIRYYPDLIHIEVETLSRSHDQPGSAIYYRNYNWSSVYGMHLYSRKYNGTVDETLVTRMNTTFGAICRHILFGNKELCAR